MILEWFQANSCRPEAPRLRGTPSHQFVPSRAGGPLRLLAAWIGWNEGWLTLRSIAAALRLRSEGYISSLIARCERAFRRDAGPLAQLDCALLALRT